MRYGFISDVHANLEALEVVLAHLDRQRVDAIVCLGDMVGYHANPNECVSLIRQNAQVCIAGNHDRAAVGSLEPIEFSATARHAIEWTRGVLESEHAAFLASLPVYRPLDAETFLVHGALYPTPNDRFHLTKPERIAQSFGMLISGKIPARVCFFGHTHRAVAYRCDGEGKAAEPVHPHGGSWCIELAAEGYYLINPGSVGQPRDDDARAGCAVFDTSRGTLELHRLEYDFASTLRRAEAHGLIHRPSLARRSLEFAHQRVDDAKDLARRVLRRSVVRSARS